MIFSWTTHIYKVRQAGKNKVYNLLTPFLPTNFPTDVSKKNYIYILYVSV